MRSSVSMSFIRPLACIATLALAACGASVSPNDGGSDAPATETFFEDLPFVDAHDVVPDETGPDVTPSADVPVTCSFATASNVRISYTGPGDQPLDCAGTPPMMPGGPGELTVRYAAVVSSTDDAMGAHVTLDFCSPAADCVPQIGSLTIQANGFNLSSGPNGLRAGQYLRIRSRPAWFFGCTMEIEIANAPSWDGAPNTVRTDDIVIAAAASGVGHAMDGSPFEVTRQSIGCQMMGPNCGGGEPEVFALSFQGHCNNCTRDPDPVVVRQGETGVFAVNGNSYIGFDARSLNSGACDDYWSYDWTAREIWLE